MVYCRDAQAWQSANSPDKDTKDWLDEQCGTLLKWSVPISSITRVEWLPKVKSDLFIIGTPVHLQPACQRTLIDLIEKGQPMMLVGSPDGGVDPELLKMAGIERQDAAPADKQTRAKLGDAGDLTAGLPAEFEIIQRPFVACKASRANKVLYTVNDSPALTINTEGRHKLIFWDPPEMTSARTRPLIESLGGVESYVLAARALTAFLPGTGSPWAPQIVPREPVAILAWSGRNGLLNLLAGNMEEGLNLDIAMSRQTAFPGSKGKQYQSNQPSAALDNYIQDERHLALNLPAEWTPKTISISLPAAGSVRLECQPVKTGPLSLLKAR